MAKRAIAFLLLALALVLPAARGAGEEAPEYQVKAAFLLNFTKFIQWPPDSFADGSTPLRICVLGEDPFGGTLNQMVDGETVNGRRLVVEHVRHVSGPQSCQVLFISLAEEEARGSVPETGPGVLTVGEGDQFLRRGGMIAFTVVNRRVRFDIQRGTAERAGLRLSSRLLNVARSVK